MRQLFPVPLIAAFVSLIVLPPVLLALGLTMTSATEVVVFAMACMALNILVGTTGLVSFGHGAWFGLAAYAAALLQRDLMPGSFVGPVIGGVIIVALIAAPFLVAYRNPDPEKLSAYECGFNSFDDARMKFDVRFYLVSILFIIFDLEVAFLFPWAVSFSKIGMVGFWSMMVFLGVLTIGFAYEWKKGALEWE